MSLQADPDSGLRVGSCPGPERQSEPPRAVEGAGCHAGPLSRGGAVQKFPRKSRAMQCLDGMNPPHVTSPMLLTQGDRP